MSEYENEKMLHSSHLSNVFSTTPQLMIDGLKIFLRCHSYLYYTLADTIITDELWDKFYRSLQALEKKHPELVTDDSPTQLVGDDISLMKGSGKTKEDIIKILRTVGKGKHNG